MFKSEIRKDYIQDKYVIIAPHRSKRQNEYKEELLIKKNDGKCAFCPKELKKVKSLLTIGNEDNWRVKVVKNIFPAVSMDNPRAYGRQEVFIEASDHLVELHELPINHIVDILNAYIARTIEVSRDKKIEYILIFKNYGGSAGASIIHSHSQLFATEFLPPRLLDKSEKVKEYRFKNGSCVYCDVIKKEMKGPRFVWKDKNVIAFCPYASMHNYEVWVMPLRHVDNITLLNNDEKKSFAFILKRLVGKIDKLGLNYNYYFHQVVHDNDQHLYLKIKPRGSVWAGVEIGSGLIINSVAPEEAAKYYRQ